MIHRLTNGRQILEITAPAGADKATVQIFPAGEFREITDRGVPQVLARYRGDGWVDPIMLALHRAAVTTSTDQARRLELQTAARAFPELTAALIRQVLGEVGGGNREAAGGLLGVSRGTLLRAVRVIPGLREEMDRDPSSRGGGWREGHQGRKGAERKDFGR